MPCGWIMLAPARLLPALHHPLRHRTATHGTRLDQLFCKRSNSLGDTLISHRSPPTVILTVGIAHRNTSLHTKRELRTLVTDHNERLKSDRATLKFIARVLLHLGGIACSYIFSRQWGKLTPSKKLTATFTKLIIVFRRETISDLLKEDERTLCLNLPSASAG